MILACLFNAGGRRQSQGTHQRSQGADQGSASREALQRMIQGRRSQRADPRSAGLRAWARRIIPWLGACCFVTAGHAVPVVPGANGHGMETPAGRGGTVYRVTNLNERGGGSLAACVAARGPRVCVFETSGTLRLNYDLVIDDPFLTIAGQTAPAPGIMLRGAALDIRTHDVLVQHLRVRVGDDLSGPSPDNRDALKIEGNASGRARNIVIDHCSFSWAIDETATAWDYYDAITFHRNIFAEPLRESLHSNLGVPGSPGQGFGLLLGTQDAGVTIVGNLFAHIVERNPASRATRLVFVNNVVYNRANRDVDLQSQNGRVTRSTVMGNVFIRGPDYTRLTRPINLRTDGDLGLPPGSRVYVRDNIATEINGDPWSGVELLGNVHPPRSALELAAPLLPLGLRGASASSVYESVLARAGARPLQRDSVDQRIVQSVRTRTGRIINCVAPNGTVRCNRNAGGWPTLAVNRRTLTLPADQATLTASGYTNLEMWLHRMATDLEGLPPPRYPGMASAPRVQ